jgi:hypothetical protein
VGGRFGTGGVSIVDEGQRDPCDSQSPAGFEFLGDPAAIPVGIPGGEKLLANQTLGDLELVGLERSLVFEQAEAGTSGPAPVWNPPSETAGT